MKLSSLLLLLLLLLLLVVVVVVDEWDCRGFFLLNGPDVIRTKFGKVVRYGQCVESIIWRIIRFKSSEYITLL